MQQPPSHLPAAYWSTDAAYNGQAAAAGWSSGSHSVAQHSPFQLRGGSGGRRGRGGQQRHNHPYQQQQQQHRRAGQSASHASRGSRGGRGRGGGGGGGGGGGAEGAMNEVWYKPSFLDDPWATLEGRPPGSILRTTDAEQTSDSLQTHPSPQHGNGDSEGKQRGPQAQSDEDAVSQTEAPQSFVSASSVAESAASFSPSLVLPPPHYS